MYLSEEEKEIIETIRNDKEKKDEVISLLYEELHLEFPAINLDT